MEENHVEINSIEDAIQIVDDKTHLQVIYDPEEERKYDPYYPFPFGIWFRGHSLATYELVPSVFRHPNGDKDKWYDEGMMIQHANLRNPAEQSFRSTFPEPVN